MSNPVDLLIICNPKNGTLTSTPDILTDNNEVVNLEISYTEEFYIRNIKPGTYNLTYNTPGYQTVAQTINILPNSDLNTVVFDANVIQVTPPTDVTNLVVSNLSSSSVSLTWDVATGATKYLVSKQTGTSIFSDPIDVFTNSYVDTNVVSGSSYTYKVKTVTVTGTSGGVTVTCTIPQPVITIPANPTLNFTKNEYNDVEITWTQSTGATGYSLERKVGASGTYSTLLNNTTTLVYSDLTVTENTTYVYRVKAINSAGTSTGAELYVTTKQKPEVIPLDPTGFTISQITPTSVSFVWNAVSNAASYIVQKQNGTTVSVNTPAFTETNLTENTTYTYIVKSVNGAGQSTGAPFTITTPYLPVADPVTFTYSSTPNSVNLQWSLVTNADFYLLKRNDQTNTTELNSTISSYIDTTVIAGNKYTYNLKAKHGNQVSTGINLDVTVPVNPPTPIPNNPTNFTATNISAASLNLSWTASSGADKYSLERKAGIAGTYIVLNSNLTVLTYTDSTVSPSTQYVYRVKAINNSGSSSGTEITVTTPAVQIPIPNDVTNLAASNITENSVILTWTAASGATSYTVEYAIGLGAYTNLTTVNSGTTYTVTNLTSNTAYIFRIKAVNSSGSSSGVTVTATTLMPTLANPTNFKYTVTSSAIALTWNPVTGADYYELRRADAGGPVNPNVTYYNDTNFTLGSTYTYTLKTVKNGIKSSGVNLTVNASITPTIPANPTNLVVTSSLSNSVQISWSASSGATSYLVSRKTGSGSFGATTEVTTLTFTDNTVVANTAYTYKVQAKNGAGSSTGSTVSVTTPVTTTIANPTGLTAVLNANSTAIHVSWNAVAGADYYELIRGSGGPVNPNVTFYDDYTVTYNTPITYNLKTVVGANKSSGVSITVTFTQNITIPLNVTNLQVTGVTDTTATISWTAASTATSYLVATSSDGGTTFGTDTETTNTTFSFTGLTANSTRVVRVKSKNANGTSSGVTVTFITSNTGGGVTPSGKMIIVHQFGDGGHADWTVLRDNATHLQTGSPYDGFTIQLAGTWEAFAPGTSGIPDVATIQSQLQAVVSAGLTKPLWMLIEQYGYDGTTVYDTNFWNNKIIPTLVNMAQAAKNVNTAAGKKIVYGFCYDPEGAAWSQGAYGDLATAYQRGQDVANAVYAVWGPDHEWISLHGPYTGLGFDVIHANDNLILIGAIHGWGGQTGWDFYGQTGFFNGLVKVAQQYGFTVEDGGEVYQLTYEADFSTSANKRVNLPTLTTDTNVIPNAVRPSYSNGTVQVSFGIFQGRITNGVLDTLGGYPVTPTIQRDRIVYAYRYSTSKGRVWVYVEQTNHLTDSASANPYVQATYDAKSILGI